MATLYIAEAASLASDGEGDAIPVFPDPVAEQTVTFTTAAQSAAFKGQTRFIRIQADAACHIKIGSDPTATAANYPLAADTEYFRAVQGGHKISVYDGSS